MQLAYRADPGLHDARDISRKSALESLDHRHMTSAEPCPVTATKGVRQCVRVKGQRLINGVHQKIAGMGDLTREHAAHVHRFHLAPLDPAWALTLLEHVLDLGFPPIAYGWRRDAGIAHLLEHVAGRLNSL